MFSTNHKNSIQPKLAIGQPNNKYEQEANTVADQVMQMPASQMPNIQRKCDKCKEEELQMKPLVQRQEEDQRQKIQDEPQRQEPPQRRGHQIQNEPQQQVHKPEEIQATTNPVVRKFLSGELE